MNETIRKIKNEKCDYTLFLKVKPGGITSVEAQPRTIKRGKKSTLFLDPDAFIRKKFTEMCVFTIARHPKGMLAMNKQSCPSLITYAYCIYATVK